MPKRNGNSLHSLWEYQATSLTGKDDPDSPTNITTGAVSPDASADEENKPVSPSSSSLHETAQLRKSVKEEAKKFEVGEKKSHEFLSLEEWLAFED